MDLSLCPDRPPVFHIIFRAKHGRKLIVDTSPPLDTYTAAVEVFNDVLQAFHDQGIADRFFQHYSVEVILTPVKRLGSRYS